jgi:hypothetical protein
LPKREEPRTRPEITSKPSRYAIIEVALAAVFLDLGNVKPRKLLNDTGRTMRLKDLLSKWNLTSLKVTTPFLEMEWEPQDADRDAAWELYVELVTRVATQRLDPDEGEEAAALESIYSLFGLTRETIKHHGRDCINFTRIAVVVLNQKVRPFTAKWHAAVLDGPLDDAARQRFRAELNDLQADLRNYTRLLSELADVEDLTDLEAV